MVLSIYGVEKNTQKTKVGDKMEELKISKIRAYRYALGKTQKDMSELLNIHHVVYGRKERMLVPFTDKEKVILLNFFKEYFPDETIDSLFFKI